MRQRRAARRFREALGATCGLLLVGVALAGCSSSTPQSKPAASGQPAPQYVGKLTLQPATGPVGTAVTATGVGLPANREVQLTWQQVTGAWKVVRDVFQGSVYNERYVPIASATTDGSGSLTATFKVPDGFGYAHNVRVTSAGKDLNQAAFKIPLAAAIAPSSGPVGTPISLTLTGIGFKLYHQNYTVSYDNVMTGWMSAVTTQGTAHATIPATGGLGVHYLSFYETGDRTPYLNLQQSPAPGPTYTFPFTVTPGDLVRPAAADAQTPAAVPAGPRSVASSGPQVWVNKVQGPPGTSILLQGSGFPASQPVQVGWDTLQGNNIGSGIGHVSKPIATSVTAAVTGAFQVSFPVPLDLQGDHKILVTAGAETATTSFAISPQAMPLEPGSGPAGTQMTIHLVGTGSTLTSNIYTVVYDNAYIGFACGFNTQGDITIHLPAAGAPGWHFIDLYPSVWKVSTIEPGGSDYIQMPQLTYAVDHPVEVLPAFHYVFNITA
jgi:hypothetical protein